MLLDHIPSAIIPLDDSSYCWSKLPFLHSIVSRGILASQVGLNGYLDLYEEDSFLEEVWNRGNLALIDELVDPTCIFHDPTATLQGPEEFKQYANMYRTAFPDINFTIEDVIAEEDKVIICWTARGTHKYEPLGISPTGKQMEVTGIAIGLLSNGKLVEGWSNFDALGMLQQLGMIPSIG